MTLTPEARVANAFTLSLNLGFRLSEDEAERVAEVMRGTSVYSHMEVQIPPRMSAAERTRTVEEFFAKFLPSTTASLLASRLKGNVEGLVVLHCPRDLHFTLIVEHS